MRHIHSHLSKFLIFNLFVSPSRWASAAAPAHLSHEEVEAVVENLEDADEAEAHAEANQAAGVADEADGGHAHVFLDQRVVGVLDEDVQHG